METAEPLQQQESLNIQSEQQPMTDVDETPAFNNVSDNVAVSDGYPVISNITSIKTSAESNIDFQSENTEQNSLISDLGNNHQGTEASNDIEYTNSDINTNTEGNVENFDAVKIPEIENDAENVSNDNLNIEIEGVVNDTDVMANSENISDSTDDQDTAATTVATPMVESENIVNEDKTMSGEESQDITNEVNDVGHIADKRGIDEVGEHEENAPKKAKLCEEEAVKVATGCEVSSSSPEKANSIKENSIGESKNSTENAVKISETQVSVASEKASEDESVAEGNDSGNMDESDDTATKLMATAGISISLIKKKKSDNPDDEEKEENVENQDTKSAENASEKPDAPANPLEVGPNISVTMINKSSSESSTTPPPKKLTLSLKSQSELLDPKKGDSSSPSANILANGTSNSDSISVSKINRPSQGSSQQKPVVKTTVAGTPPNLMVRSNLTGGSMPGLHPRPNNGFLNRPSGSSQQPLAAAGSVSEQLNLVANGIAEYMRHGIEEILRELSAQGSAEATIKGLQLEMERMQWRHQKELQEVKSNIDNMIKEMKTNMAKESQRTIEEFKKQAEIEKQKAILETKKKQWCAHCGKEAIFYCCWNTSYCDYPCQQAHWPSHMSTCAQTNSEEDSNTSASEPQEQKPLQISQHPAAASASPASIMNSLNRPVSGMTAMNSLGMSQSHAGMTPNSMGGYMMGMGGMNMRPGGHQGMGGMRTNPMGVSIRPGMPGQLTISRPYFM